MIKKVIEIDVDVLNANGGLEKLEQSFKDANKETESLRTQMRKAQQEVAQLSEKFGATSKEAVNAAKRAGEEAKSIREQKRKEELEKINASAKEIQDALLEAEKQKAEILKKGEQILKDLELSKESPTEKLKREYEEKLAILQSANLSTLELTAEFNNQLFQLNEKARQDDLTNEKINSDAKKAIAQAEAKAKIDALDAVSATLNNASDLLGKQTTAGKVLAIASATISMFTSAQKAYEATVGIPIVGPTLAPINAGLAIASGIKNIQSIAKIKVPNGGGGSGSPSIGGGGGSPQAQAPSFNVVGNAGVNQIAQTLGKEQPPVQAYVVANNVTTAQSANRNIIENASLG